MLEATYRVFGPFAVTEANHAHDTDWSSIASSVSDGQYCLATWKDLKAYGATQGESALVSTLDALGITRGGRSAHLTNAGQSGALGLGVSTTSVVMIMISRQISWLMIISIRIC